MPAYARRSHRHPFHNADSPFPQPALLIRQPEESRRGNAGVVSLGCDAQVQDMTRAIEFRGEDRPPQTGRHPASQAHAQPLHATLVESGGTLDPTEKLTWMPPETVAVCTVPFDATLSGAIPESHHGRIGGSPLESRSGGASRVAYGDADLLF